jgi:U2 small nuclear ribonucleoprotein B''
MEVAAEPAKVKGKARSQAPPAARAAAAAPAPVRAAAPVNENEPNEKLFLQGLPAELDDMALQMLFQQFQGFKESRTVPGRVGIAFVEFNMPAQAAIARERLQGFKLTDEHFMQISFAKR